MCIKLREKSSFIDYRLINKKSFHQMFIEKPTVFQLIGYAIVSSTFQEYTFSYHS